METGNAIDQLLNRKIPERLWHYTSLRGFERIVSTKEIHATDIRFLNDREEFIHTRKIAEDLISEMPKRSSAGAPVRKWLQRLVQKAFSTGPLSSIGLQVFVASFSAAEDQLSQWRGYSRGSSGASLGLNLGTIRPQHATEDLVSFGPCVYSLSEKKELLRCAFQQVSGGFDGWYITQVEGIKRLLGIGSDNAKVVDAKLENDSVFERLADDMEKTSTDLLRVAALLKNASFSEEKEWRLVVTVLKQKRKAQVAPLFRATKTTLVPYIVHPLTGDAKASLPLVDLIMGPGSHPSSLHATAAFLKSQAINIEPRLSDVPYNPW